MPPRSARQAGARDGSTFSMRTGMTGFFLLIARSTSRATKSD
jgi:hypothetical protein